MNTLKNLLYVSALLLSITSFSSCKKKQSKKLTTVEFHMYNPVTGEPFSGVKVGVAQMEQKSNGPFKIGDKYVKTIIWEGETDENGKASYSFYAYSNNKYQYWPLSDQSFMSSYNVVNQPMFDSFNKDQENKLVWQITNNVFYNLWIKNINCNDVFDKFRYSLRAIETIFSNTVFWDPIAIDNVPQFYTGCYEYKGSEIISSPQHIWEVTMETTRNNITTTKIDTFYLTGKNGIDTLKLFY